MIRLPRYLFLLVLCLTGHSAFALSMNQPIIPAINPGETATTTIVFDWQGQPASTVTLSTGALPAGMTASFDPPQTSSSSVLRITTSPTLAPNNYMFRVFGHRASQSYDDVTFVTVNVTPVAMASCPRFPDYASYPITDMSRVSTGDVNGDGIPDVVGAGGTSISVLLGNADGTLGPAATVSIGAKPVAIVTADLNHDGRADVITSNDVSGISILLANANGTLSAATTYSASSGTFVAVGDLNLDGNIDLVTNTSVLLGKGDGTVNAVIPYTTGSNVAGAVIADFDRDGKPDLVCGNNTNPGGLVSFLKGNGDGTFGAPVSLPASYLTPIAAADMNRDGKLDVIAHSALGVTILVGHGDGTFTQGTDTPLAQGVTTHGTAVADIDGDGVLDVVDMAYTAGLSVLWGDGTGSLHPELIANLSQSSLAVTDLNLDGRPDLILARGIGVMLNESVCSRNCGSATITGNPSSGSAFAVADFDRDGNSDLVMIDRTANTATVALGTGDGTFAASTPIAVGANATAVVTGDFDHDGLADVAVTNRGSDNVAILRGNGDGTLGTAANYSTLATPAGIAVGDFDRDGRDDLAITSVDANAVAILKGLAAAAFGSPTSYAVGNQPIAVVTGDFNRDGKLDLAVANSGSGTVSILLANNDGTFQSGATLTAGTNPTAVVARDLNQDGLCDLAVTNAGSNNISFFAGHGDGTFEDAQNFATGDGPAALVAVDLNDDGRLDLVSANGGSNDVSVLFSTSAGGFLPAVSYASLTSPAALVSGDFNDDGKPDLATSSSSHGGMTILNGCLNSDLTITLSHAGSFVQGDRDKTYEIVVTNGGTGATTGYISVQDSLPAGVRATAMTGDGWTCDRAVTICHRSDALSAGASYPTITLTVDISGSAPPTIINTATVAGGGEINRSNDTANDSASVSAAADLAIVATHDGNFTQGAIGRTFVVRVNNQGRAATTGLARITVSLAAGLSATAMTGSGWNCTVGTTSCERNDVLAPGAAYSPILVTVNVNANATGRLTSTFTIAESSDANSINDTVTDSVIVWAANACNEFNEPQSIAAVDVDYYLVIKMIAVDLNGDGALDLVATGTGPSAVFVILGHGDGSFDPAVGYPLSYQPDDFAVGDFNNDGHLDIVVSAPMLSMVFLGKGDGSFYSPIPSNIALTHIAVADFDGDGNADILGLTRVEHAALIAFGNGNGTIGRETAIDAPLDNRIAVQSDVNGDGHPDVIVAAPHGLKVFLNHGDGTFLSPVIYDSSQEFIDVLTGDIDRDGDTDLIALGDDGTLHVFAATGSGSFAAGVTYSYLQSDPWGSQLFLEDVDADGYLDVIALGYIDLPIRYGSAEGTFNRVGTLRSTLGATAVTDLNNDGRMDLAQWDYPGISVQFGGCTDFSVGVQHTGSFVRGQNGTYVITAAKTGPSSERTVTVTDTLPVGLSAVSLSGNGWSCDLGTLTCTRPDSTTGNVQYDPITLVVSVSSDAPLSVTNAASVSGDHDASNNTASDLTTIILAPPQNLVATAVTTNSVHLTWSSVPDAVRYEILRGTNLGNLAVVWTAGANTYDDTHASEATTYIYQVRAHDGVNPGALSSKDIATTLLFTDDPVVARGTPIRAIHFSELRDAVNAVRIAAGLTPFAFTDTLPGSRIKAIHVTELRTALDEARAAIGLATLSYNDSTLVHVQIKATHINELRQGVR